MSSIPLSPPGIPGEIPTPETLPGDLPHEEPIHIPNEPPAPQPIQD